MKFEVGITCIKFSVKITVTVTDYQLRKNSNYLLSGIFFPKILFFNLLQAFNVKGEKEDKMRNFNEM